MTRTRLALKRFSWFLVILFLVGLAATAAAASGGLLISPERVDIGTFFEGTRISISGEVPAGTQAVVEVVGAASAEHLMRKGRRGGLWMNVGEIEITDAPSFYLVLSSRPELITAPAGEVPWGYPALKRAARLSGSLSPAESASFFEQFRELKESEGLYGLRPGALTVTPAGEGARVEGTAMLPAKIAPGTYMVRLTAVKDGWSQEQGNALFTVKMVSFPALMADLAYQYAALHGIMAVLIAIATGFIMGFLFKGKGGAH